MKRRIDMTHLLDDVKKPSVLKLALESASEHIVVTDAHGVVLYANPAVERITGFDREEILGQKAGGRDLWGGLMPEGHYRAMWEKLKAGYTYRGELRNRHKSGREYVADLVISPAIDEQSGECYYIGIERDITDAKRSDELKDQFISLVSHQLFTPMSVLKWNMDLILEDDGQISPGLRARIVDCYEANETMIGVVDAMLTVTRLESGRVKLNATEMDLELFFRSTLKPLRQLMQTKGQVLELKFEGMPKTAWVDEKLVANVVTSLASNASKYAPSNTTVELLCHQQEGDIRIEVADRGVGVSQQESQSLFEKFYRTESSR